MALRRQALRLTVPFVLGAGVGVVVVPPALAPWRSPETAVFSFWLGTLVPLLAPLPAVDGDPAEAGVAFGADDLSLVC
jgi:hypothetical protein